ncbi:MAG TPA: DUF6599 family protein [Acidobacteriota bacterium]|nr:DUF6599 family protein [Acidobacteriota bacterium]
MQSDKINLPDTIDGWKLTNPPKMIDKTNIFDYMNGAGELYLSYHFDHLLVYEYKNKSDNDILVELYYMNDSKDAFGLLSLDWGGEAVELNQPQEEKPGESIVPRERALYGKGLLRVWSDNLYIRIMAFKDIPGVKEVILQLGKIITADRRNPSPPEMLKAIQPFMTSPWTLKRDRTAYFYSHLVLNSLFYLSHENILSLDQSTEAVIATYERELKSEKQQSARLLVIKYPDHKQAVTALNDFFRFYFPDQNEEVKPDVDRESQGFFHIEDGWMGYRLINQGLALVFECPDQESAQEIINQAF